MFVRFRKLPNNGFEPRAAREGVAVWSWEKRAAWGKRGDRRRRNQRRWVIGREERLQPYRIKVMVIENSRVDGKIKQDVIARLGSIDATWLESFWANAPPELRTEHWELYSLRARTAFFCRARSSA